MNPTHKHLLTGVFIWLMASGLLQGQSMVMASVGKWQAIYSKTFEITINGETTIITPNSPQEFETALKTLWKKAFVDNAEQMFNTIWDNQALRSNLFGTRNETAAMNYFTSLINNENSLLYDFIKIE